MFKQWWKQKKKARKYSTQHPTKHLLLLSTPKENNRCCTLQPKNTIFSGFLFLLLASPKLLPFGFSWLLSLGLAFSASARSQRFCWGLSAIFRSTNNRTPYPPSPSTSSTEPKSFSMQFSAYSVFVCLSGVCFLRPPPAARIEHTNWQIAANVRSSAARDCRCKIVKNGAVIVRKDV